MLNKSSPELVKATPFLVICVIAVVKSNVLKEALFAPFLENKVVSELVLYLFVCTVVDVVPLVADVNDPVGETLLGPTLAALADTILSTLLPDVFSTVLIVKKKLNNLL